MAQTKIVGGGVGTQVIASGVEAAVDPLYLAGRIALRPLDYTGAGGVLGHYAVAQTSGAVAATPTAADIHASIRWAPGVSNVFLVLLRLKFGWSVISEITAGVQMAYKATIARQFTTDYTGGSTAINMSTTAKTNAMRSSMSNSLMGASGPRITTTGAMSSGVNVLDNAAFAIMNNTVPGVSGAVKVEPGVSSGVMTMYECTGAAQHPIVLGNNEGVVVAINQTGWASGTVSLYSQWEWAEVSVF